MAFLMTLKEDLKNNKIVLFKSLGSKSIRNTLFIFENGAKIVNPDTDTQEALYNVFHAGSCAHFPGIPEIRTDMSFYNLFAFLIITKDSVACKPFAVISRLVRKFSISPGCSLNPYLTPEGQEAVWKLTTGFMFPDLIEYCDNPATFDFDISLQQTIGMPNLIKLHKFMTKAGTRLQIATARDAWNSEKKQFILTAENTTFTKVGPDNGEFLGSFLLHDGLWFYIERY